MAGSPGERLNARAILASCGVPMGADFHRLANWQVSALIEAADRARYRQPRNANGSRTRYFHAFLQRVAARQPADRWTVEPGRWLHRDGLPVFALQRGDGVNPTEVDKLAHTVCRLLNEARKG